MPVATAPMPDHGRVNDPLWQLLWTRYSRVITPLRRFGLPTDIETCGGEFVIYADLPDGTHLTLASEHSLAMDPDANNGWVLSRDHRDNPTVHEVLYDSSDAGPDHTNGLDRGPLLGAVLELLDRLGVAWC
ncbi:hypothetical protein GCM10020367_20680 [Streptomyces sannanensis]|uniref:Uncharacterized protein n=1 Tax=Streptomyces sannanensis TaxID=285536 RepID=A0ABP6S8Z3_9ACTN